MLVVSVPLSLLLAALLSPSSSHPQCLDFQPPFQENSLSYCTEYKDFGCCVADGDEAARERASGASANVSETQRQLCASYLKNISCVTCSPYVAHIYETEGGGEPQAFPELCGSYCLEAYRNCYAPLLKMLGLEPWEQGLVSREPANDDELARDARAFCEHYIPEDSPYCYPRVLDGPDIEGFSTEQVGELGCICGQPVATGLRNPLAAVHAGDGSGRLFIAEQIGVVRVLDKDNNLLEEPFLDITSDVLTSSRKGDERGLLGMAFHPNYTRNGLFYIYYSSRTDGSHHSIVSEFHVNEDDPNTANLTSQRVLLSISQPRGNHNGGQLLFKDGYLLVFLGDGGGAGDTFQNGLNLATLHGSVLRIDVDHRDPGKEYATPPDNPFVGDPNARPEIYAYGIRNAWRCSIDRGDRETGEGAGRIFCGDVGQRDYEEVDIIVKGGNYGWNAFEGHSCFQQSLCQNDTLSSEVIPPIHVYPHSVGVSITGGYVYRGCAFPNLQGLYIFGDYGSGRVFALRENQTSGEWESMELCMGDSSVCTGSLVGEERLQYILSFGEDEDGELYILTTSLASTTAAEGVVYRMVDPARQTSPAQCEDNNINLVPASTAVRPLSSGTGLMESGEATGLPSGTTLPTSSTYLVQGASPSRSAELYMYTTPGIRPTATVSSISNTELPTISSPIPTIVDVVDTGSDLCEQCPEATSDLCEQCLNSTRGGGSQPVIIRSLLVSMALPVALALSNCMIVW